MITRRGKITAGIEQRSRSHDIGADELLRMFNGTVHMRLRRKVDDDIGLYLLEKAVDKLAVRDVAADKAVVRRIFDRLAVFKVAGIGQLIEVDDLILRIGVDQVLDHDTADKAGTARNDNLHI